MNSESPRSFALESKQRKKFEYLGLGVDALLASNDDGSGHVTEQSMVNDADGVLELLCGLSLDEGVTEHSMLSFTQ